MTSNATTANAYYASLPEERRDALITIRERIAHIWPEIKEDMLYHMPTFHLNGRPLCAIASQKHFMALYVMPYDLLDAFKNDLKVQDHGRSCIRFKRLDAAMLGLLDRIVRFTGAQQDESTITEVKDPIRHSSKRVLSA
ncbi:MAG: DUF1801 domain-containing protein [Flavobacteriales bacterium]